MRVFLWAPFRNVCGSLYISIPLINQALQFGLRWWWCWAASSQACLSKCNISIFCEPLSIYNAVFHQRALVLSSKPPGVIFWYASSSLYGLGRKVTWRRVVRLKFIKKSTGKVVTPVLCPQSDELYSTPRHFVNSLTLCVGLMKTQHWHTSHLSATHHRPWNNLLIAFILWYLNIWKTFNQAVILSF